MESFFEENHGIQNLDTYKKITLHEYRALHIKGAPRATLTMCVLTIKKDEALHLLLAKFCIVVLGDHEDRVWSTSDKFAPPILSPVLNQFGCCILLPFASGKL